MIDERERLFWANANLLHPSGCWPMGGATNSSGYVTVTIAGKHIGAHVASVLYSGRSIPAGMTVDHRCKNRICVNPAHLEVVTGYENNIRSDSWAGKNARKTHCINGHAFDAENTHYDKGKRSGRVCRKCHAERERKRRQKLREESLDAVPMAA